VSPLPATVGIVGLGLIGGSLARDLAGLGARVVAVERDPASLHAARAADILHAGGAEPELLDDAGAVILALPPRTAVGMLPGLAPHLRRARWVTDVAGTKTSILAAARAAGLGPRFVGSHPMAGGTGSGFGASRAGLFRGARVYLCAGEATADVAAATHGFWERLGGVCVPIAAGEHDRRCAWASHLPQFAATTLAATLHRAGIDTTDLGAGGRDATRLAASAAALWTELAADNGGHLAAALEALHAGLGDLLAALRSGDAAAVAALLEEGRRWRGGEMDAAANPAEPDRGR
jgi:prephenate dehydrogenase